MPMSRSEHSPSPSRSGTEDAHQALATLRLSVDSDDQRPLSNGTPVLVNGVNGKQVRPTNGDHTSELDVLRQELEDVRAEKENLETQYRSLVSRVNTMKSTLGNKLKQDAEELDRREQQIQHLTAQNEDLQQTIQALQTEIVASNAESERASKELELMRSRAFEEGAQESLLRERELREAQMELERCRIERDDWERAAQESRIQADEARAALEVAKRELDFEKEAGRQMEKDLASERERSANLQSVLEDFQMAKAHELRQAVRDIEARLQDATQSLAEYKHRAHTAEMQLEESSADTSRTAELEKEVKEKNLLIGKLRHEAVIMNEHLMEALRRLRKSSNDTNVDRRLVTNVLLSFLTTPRTDTKRFEMLNLLASILSWNDVEREKAGLQRAGSSGAGGTWGRPASPKGKGAELEKGDETESFSQMWVEFLLRESSTSSSGLGSPTTTDATAFRERATPNTGTQPLPPLVPPSRTTSSVSITGSPKSGRASPVPGFFRSARLPSFTSMGLATQKQGNEE